MRKLSPEETQELLDSAFAVINELLSEGRDGYFYVYPPASYDEYKIQQHMIKLKPYMYAKQTSNT